MSRRSRHLSTTFILFNLSPAMSARWLKRICMSTADWIWRPGQILFWRPSGNRNYLETLKDICAVVNGPVSAEAVSLDMKGMMQEAYKYREIAPNINVKFPMTVEGLSSVADSYTSSAL